MAGRKKLISYTFFLNLYRFTCLDKIEKDEADLITLDSGLGYFAGRQHNMMPIMAEDYGYRKNNFVTTVTL